MVSKRHLKLIKCAPGIIGNEKRELGFYPNFFIQVTLPHSKPKRRDYWENRSGAFYASIQSDQSTNNNGSIKYSGIPYGSLPRLILAYFGRQVQLTNSPLIDVRRSLSSFMSELGIIHTGGQWGRNKAIKQQLIALLAAKYSWGYGDSKRTAKHQRLIADSYDLWWDTKSEEQQTLFNNWIKLSEPVFQEFKKRSVPLDMDVLKVLKQSPMELDIYAWGTARLYNLSGKLIIPTSSLHKQFGADYARQDNFVAAFKKHYLCVHAVWPDLDIEFQRGRIILHPAQPHIIPLQKK